MTAESTQSTPRSRRALLAGALSGLGAWAAAAAARVDPAAAAAGDPIRMGRLNGAGGTSTTLRTKTSNNPAFLVKQLGHGPGVRVQAQDGNAVMAGVDGHGIGVWAYSPDKYAVSANSPEGTALFGYSIRGKALHAVGTTKLSGNVVLTGVQDVRVTNPGAPPDGFARLFARINDGGMMELCVLFHTGAVQVLATEP
jgi:hypothetical protein